MNTIQFTLLTRTFLAVFLMCARTADAQQDNNDHALYPEHPIK